MNVSSNNISLVVKELDAMDARIMQAAEVGLRRGLLGAVGIIQRQFLSGPRPSKLDVRLRGCAIQFRRMWSPGRTG
jgi:hypothetical protein